SVSDHREMGMVLHVDATGQAAPDSASLLDFSAEPGPGFAPHEATLPPLEPGRVHRRTFTVSEVERAVAPGDGQSVRQRLWTYDGGAPGPTLHGRIGDTFVITLVNDGSM